MVENYVLSMALYISVTSSHIRPYLAFSEEI